MRALRSRERGWPCVATYSATSDPCSNTLHQVYTHSGLLGVSPTLRSESGCPQTRPVAIVFYCCLLSASAWAFAFPLHHIKFGAAEGNRILLNPLDRRLHSQSVTTACIWCPRRDSNPYCTASKTVVSCQLDYPGKIVKTDIYATP